MTDIDALIYECRALTNSGFGLCRSQAIDLLDALTTEREKVAALETKLAHIRLIEHDTSSSHSEKLGAIFKIARAGTSDHYSASDMHDNPERETVGDVSEAKEWEDYDRDC